MTEKPIIEIEYCSQCQWLLRSAWLAQELLGSVDVSLRAQWPRKASYARKTCAACSILHGEEIWERKKNRGVPQPKEIKQRVRDVIDPRRDLGHNDR